MTGQKPRRYGMVIDLDRCTGCGGCMIACAAENNVAPGEPKATPRTSITLMRVHTVSNAADGAEHREAFVPLMCMQCEHETPCVHVCPQQAVEIDPATGIVTQMPQRCLGCRYCMTACPYHARYFNWSDPSWPKGMEQTLNPGVAVRMRGVVEKCNMCHARLHAAEDQAAVSGAAEHEPSHYNPACAEACPTSAITFGDLADPQSEVSKLAHEPSAFRLLEQLGTQPKVYYKSNRSWVRDIQRQHGAPTGQEVKRG
jgi:menaquinone reductase, iron-sulfur cluster-binding subunit